jgi:putative membrane protein
MSEQKNSHISDHLANERTFLAWIRTALGIMAFGFVVVKFSLFVKQLSLVLDKKISELPTKGYSSTLGICLVFTGSLITVFSFIRYKRIEKQINAENFRQTSPLLTVLTIAIFLMGLLLITYLVMSINAY